MDSRREYDVAIVGGGMVGVSLALALGEALPGKGRVLLVESFPLPAQNPDFAAAYSPSFDARSTALSYSSQLIYTQMGIWDQLEQRAGAIASIHVSEKGRFGSTLLQAADYEWPALGYVIENAWLGNVLVQCLHQQGQVDILSPAKVTGVEPGTGGVELHFSDGAEARCELLVVADGADSALREALGIAVNDRPYQQHAVVANISHALPHGGRAYERFTEQGPLACLPLPAEEAAPATGASSKRSALVWTLSESEAVQMQSCPEAEFLQCLQQRFGYRLGRLLRVGERHSYPLSLVRAEEQVRSRVVVIGNAAHALHPVAGQGFNLALRDVAKLVDVLAGAEAAGEDFFELECLRRYSLGQHPDQERTVAFSDHLPGLFMNRDPALGLLRDFGLFALDLSPGLKREFVQQTAGTAASAGYRNVRP
jgi:2-octaprenyl-6-methoxyphenol hydroxylase